MVRNSSAKAIGAAPENIGTEEPGPREWHLLRLLHRYSDMLRSAVDWLWETDAGLTLTHVSPPVAAALGIPSRMLVGRSLLHLFALDASDPAARRLTGVVAARRAFRDEHFVIASSGGKKTPVRIAGVPYYDEETGDFAGYRGTGTALPEAIGTGDDDGQTAGELLALLESALARKDQLEWELSREGDEAFQLRLAGVAHELRTPLNAIIGFAEVMKDRHLGDDPARYRDYARNIHESGLHLLEVISDLLDLSRIDAGRLRPDRELIDIEEIVAGALRMLADKAEEAEVALVDDIEPGIPEIAAERRAVRQILINLLSNAIKFTPRGGSVGIEGRKEGDRVIALTVWDTGVGIAPENQVKVFERAYRVTTPGLERPGSGLGLAISRDLARALGGDVGLSSTLGEGTRVTLKLPLGGR